MRSLDGKRYTTDAADVETMLRIVQSIQSPKAELVKQWLAKAGAEKLEEMAESGLRSGMTAEQRPILVAPGSTSSTSALNIVGSPCFALWLRLGGDRGRCWPRGRLDGHAAMSYTPSTDRPAGWWGARHP